MKKNKIFKSEKDRNKFFDAIFNPSKPNKKLIEAVKKYKKLIN
jgi:uncharacterized protein (DUF1778 family)